MLKPTLRGPYQNEDQITYKFIDSPAKEGFGQAPQTNSFGFNAITIYMNV